MKAQNSPSWPISTTCPATNKKRQAPQSPYVLPLLFDAVKATLFYNQYFKTISQLVLENPNISNFKLCFYIDSELQKNSL